MVKRFSCLLILSYYFCSSLAFLSVHPGNGALNQPRFPSILNAEPQVQEMESTKMDTIDGSNASYDLKNGRRVEWKAQCSGTKQVVEGPRSLDAYLALPPSEYSVLDANLIERLNENEFRCEIDPLNFFGNKVIPVLYVRVDVSQDKPMSTISVTKCEIKGSEAALKANGAFTVEADNVVSYEKVSTLVRKMRSDVSLRITAVLPENLPLPVRLVNRTGNFILQTSLNLITNRFVSILAKDYKQWSVGKNDERKPVEEE